MARVRIPLNHTKASDMPAACIVCGGQVDAHISRSFTWRPTILSWGFWVALFVCQPAMLLLFIIGLANTRRATLECPVCERHRGYWAWRGFVAYAPLFVVTAVILTVAILLMARLVSGDYFPHLLLGSAGALLLWAIVASLVGRTGLRAVEITQDDIILTPVDATFADLLRYERQRRKSAPDYGWEEYDPYPRRPSPQQKSTPA